jgi:hypothetical protein
VAAATGREALVSEATSGAATVAHFHTHTFDEGHLSLYLIHVQLCYASLARVGRRVHVCISNAISGKRMKTFSARH